MVWFRRSTLLAIALVTVAWVPSRLCAREAASWFRGAAPTEDSLERALAEIVERPLSTADFPHGSRVLDGEWLFATYMMAGMGFGQMALEHPERRARELALMDKCIDRLVSKSVRAFDTEAWKGDDPLLSLEPRGEADGKDDHAHVSYLGYLNLLLSLDRLLDPAGRWAPLSDRITAALARRFSREPLLPSYPEEYFPVDNAAAIASLALYDRATHGSAHARLVREFAANLKSRWRDGRTGLLHQTEPHGRPRGSGTMLASYFLSFADRGLSGELYLAGKRSLYDSVLGFGAFREYPRGMSGRGDADSGPLVFGFGTSATGFGLGAARANGDEALFAKLYGTVELFGAPVERGGVRRYTSGGSVGNAILFAMLTAPRSLP